jgi:hypothetical protein
MKIIYNGDGNEFDMENLLQNKFPCFITLGVQSKIYFDNQFDSKFNCNIEFEEDIQEIIDRTSSICGGDNLMSGHSMITLKKINDIIYKVMNLDYYSPIYGWRPVFVDGILHEVDFSKPVGSWPRYIPNLQKID